eukprot:GFUD01027544.1.p1 GENE.GFUD01027544.1~~GFUD01027544.1.p1  ORF type:complete len:437 (+),score=113.07 GFUD01027544.1:82-1392(+)
MSEVCAEAWSPDSSVSAEGQVSDDANIDVETILSDDKISGVFDSSSSLFDTSQEFHEDVNNNIQCSKQEMILDDTFVDMINETYEQMMKTQVSNNKAPEPSLQSNLAWQGPLAKSSPKSVTVRHIPRNTHQDQVQVHNTTNVIKIAPKSEVHQFLTSLVFKPVSAGILSHPSCGKIFTKQTNLAGQPTSSQVSGPMSFTWKGFQGGLQRNIKEMNQEPLPLTQGGVQALPDWFSTLNIRQNPRTCVLSRKPSLGNYQYLTRGVPTAKPQRSVVSLFKPVHKSLPPIIITKPPVKYWRNRDSEYLLPRKPKKVLKQKFLRQFIAKPKKIPAVSPSGWVTKEDPVKEKKNQVERERRWELAMYREELKKMLPSIREMEKVPTVLVIGAARDHCVKIQMELNELEVTRKMEETRKEDLSWKLARLQYQMTRGHVFSRIS